MPRLSAKAVVDKAESKAKPASRKGGARVGAGRKSKAEKNKSAITKAEAQIKDRLPELIGNLFHLACGGYERITRVFEPAGLVMIDTVEYSDDGKAIKSKRLAFPNLPAEQLVEVRRTVTIADKDRKANEYLADRIMGRPQQPVKFEDLSDDELVAKIKEIAGGSGS